MNIEAVMDELAERLKQAPSLEGRTFAYPPATVTVPAGIVTYPTDGEFDKTYGRGMDSMTGVVVVVVGRPTDRTTRGRIGGYINGSGPESVKALLDGDDYTSCDSVRVARWETDIHTIAGIDYLAAIFQLDIAGQGA